MHLGREKAQILRDDVMPADRLFDGLEKCRTGALAPDAFFRGLAGSPHAIVGFKAAEVIEAHDIELRAGMCHTADPPGIALLFVHVPAVERIAPELSRFGKRIRRTARHLDHVRFLIQIKELRIRPDIRRIIGDINRQIADDPYPFPGGMGLESAPLSVKDELNKIAEADFIRVLPSGQIERTRPAQAQILLPGVPGLSAVRFLERHEQRIIRQPGFVPADKGMQLTHDTVTPAFGKGAALVRLAQRTDPLRIELSVIDGLAAAKVIAPERAFVDPALLREVRQIDEVRIAGKGGKGLVGRIPVAGRSHRQHLPVGASGRCEKVHKRDGLFGKTADAVR